MPAPAGTMGYTHSDGETFTLSTYGPGAGCGSARPISGMPAPAGPMGYTHSDGETFTLSRYGPGVETASSSAARRSRGLSMVLPVKPYAPANLAASGKQSSSTPLSRLL